MILPEIIVPNQGAFIQGRFTAHNIIICQDIVRHFGRKQVKPSCIIKMDLKKAYDSIDGIFLEDLLRASKFPDVLVQLIMECVTSPSYSFINTGSLVGFFKGKKRTQIGGPSLLFV